MKEPLSWWKSSTWLWIVNGKEICELLKSDFSVSVCCGSEKDYWITFCGTTPGDPSRAWWSLSQAGAQSWKGSLERTTWQNLTCLCGCGFLNIKNWCKVPGLINPSRNSSDLLVVFFCFGILFLSCLQWGLEFHKAEDNSLSLTADPSPVLTEPHELESRPGGPCPGNLPPALVNRSRILRWPYKMFLGQGEVGSTRFHSLLLTLSLPNLVCTWCTYLSTSQFGLRTFQCLIAGG